MHKPQVAYRNRPAAKDLIVPVAVSEGVELLQIADRMAGLVLNPFTQPALQGSMTHLEGPRRQCLAGANGHDTRLVACNGNKDGDQFGVGKPDRHWLTNPSLQLLQFLT